MKRVFICQPMRGKSDAQIILEREQAIARAKELAGDEIEVIDSFFQDHCEGATPLYLLGKSLELLATADVMYCAPGYERARGCRIEKLCALEYKIPILEEY